MSCAKITIKSLPVRAEGPGPKRVREERGELAVLFPQGPVYNPVYFDIRPGPDHFRGSHYHLDRVEHFYIIQGTCRLHYVDLDTEEKGTLTVSQGDLITVRPGCAHRLEALELCRAVEFSGSVPSGSDSIPYDFSEHVA